MLVLDAEFKLCLSVLRYGGLSVGGQLPILDVDPGDIQSVFYQLGRMLNVSAVITHWFLFSRLIGGCDVKWVGFVLTRCFPPQGHYSRLALRDLGTFLHYMESEFNVKVGFLLGGEALTFMFLLVYFIRSVHISARGEGTSVLS